MTIARACALLAACCVAVACSSAWPPVALSIPTVPAAPLAAPNLDLWTVQGLMHVQWYGPQRVLVAVDSSSEGRDLDGVVEHLFLACLMYPDSPQPTWHGSGTLTLAHGVLRVVSHEGDEKLLLLFGEAVTTGRRPPPSAPPQAMVLMDDNVSQFRLADFESDWTGIGCIEDDGTCIVLFGPRRILKFPVKSELSLSRFDPRWNRVRRPPER